MRARAFRALSFSASEAAPSAAVAESPGGGGSAGGGARGGAANEPDEPAVDKSCCEPAVDKSCCDCTVIRWAEVGTATSRLGAGTGEGSACCGSGAAWLELALELPAPLPAPLLLMPREDGGPGGIELGGDSGSKPPPCGSVCSSTVTRCSSMRRSSWARSRDTIKLSTRRR